MEAEAAQEERRGASVIAPIVERLDLRGCLSLPRPGRLVGVAVRPNGGSASVSLAMFRPAAAARNASAEPAEWPYTNGGWPVR